MTLMLLRDLLNEHSARYRHLSPGKRRLRVTNIKVAIATITFSIVVMVGAFLVRIVYDNRALFNSWLN
jgi:hypothetical protein